MGAAAVVAALVTVAWRQSSAREVMEELAEVERQLELAADERELLARELMVMEGRAWVLQQSGARLGMRPPREDEFQFLPGVEK